jgi:hypothetical protein
MPRRTALYPSDDEYNADEGGDPLLEELFLYSQGGYNLRFTLNSLQQYNHCFLFFEMLILLILILLVNHHAYIVLVGNHTDSLGFLLFLFSLSLR